MRHTHTQASIVHAAVNIYISSLCPVRVVAHQPPPYFDPVHNVRVLWGYAASGEPPQRHCLQLRPRADQGHGTTNTHTHTLHLSEIPFSSIKSTTSPGQSRLWGELNWGGRSHVGHHDVGSSALQPERVSSLGRDLQRDRDLITTTGDEGKESKDNT